MSLQDIFGRKSTGTGTTVAIALLSAAAAAGATYFLFETDAGTNKRRQIQQGFDKMKRKAGDMRENLIGESNELTDVSREIYSDMKAMLRDKADILAKVQKDEVAALADRIRNHWDEIREDIEDTVDKVAEESTEIVKE